MPASSGAAGGGPGGWDYRFSHAIVRDTLYGGLTRLQRSRLHLRVGEALEAFDRPDDPALLGRLVHHFTMTARPGSATPTRTGGPSCSAQVAALAALRSPGRR